MASVDAIIILDCHTDQELELYINMEALLAESRIRKQEVLNRVWTSTESEFQRVTSTVSI